MEADIEGSQRKVVTSTVRPRDKEAGASGIAIREGRSLPFEVRRAWSAPAGVYAEQWALADLETRQVLFESEPREVLIWGLQGLTELSDEVLTSVELSAGPHVVVFLLGALKGGEVEVDVFEAPAEEAA